MKAQTRICKSSYIDEYGNVTMTNFYVQLRKSFLGIKWWKSIQHPIGGISDVSYHTTTFPTYEDAFSFATKIQKGTKPCNWKETVINEF